MKYFIVLVAFLLPACAQLQAVSSVLRTVTGDGMSVSYTDKVDVCADDSCVLEEGSQLSVLYCSKCRVDKEVFDSLPKQKQTKANKDKK